MTASIRVEGAHVIAAMTPPTSKAPFNRGQLILRASDGTTIRARTYTSDGNVEGPLLSAEDLRELVETGQIIDLSTRGSIAAKPGASLWVLRRNLPGRDRALTELRMSELLLHEALDADDDAKLCIVAEGLARATELLDRWRNDAMEAAQSHAQRGEWEGARQEAEIAQALCRGLDAEVLALLGLAYVRCGREKRAAGLLIMARRSRGPEFEDRVVRARARFELTFTPSRPARALPRHDLAAALRRFPSAAKDLGKPRSCRLPA